MGSAIGFTCRIVSLALLLGGLAVGQSRSSNSDDHLTLLYSSDAKGSLTTKRLSDCLNQLVREWDLKEGALPNIVVIHVSNDAAHAANITENVVVRRNLSAKDGKGYFELWIKGEPNLRAVIVGLETILESHFDLRVRDEERKTVMNRVLLIQDATVSAYEGK